MKEDNISKIVSSDLPPITMFVIQYDKICKGNKYRYSPTHNRWFCCESKSKRYLHSAACLSVQSELNRIAEREGYSFASYRPEPEIKSKKSKESSKTKSKKTKNFISLF